MADPYETLGVAKTASADEIRRAFRSQAKKSHPDLHPGDKAAEGRFKALNAANEILSDPEKRGAFDRGEIDAEGQPVMPERSYYRDYAQQAGGARYHSAGGMRRICSGRSSVSKRGSRRIGRGGGGTGPIGWTCRSSRW